MRITPVISSLSAGGAERVMSVMANYWAKKGWTVTLITLADIEDDFYELHPAVQRIALNVLAESPNPIIALRNNFRRIFALRRAISVSNPNVVISFIERTNILVLVATRGLGIPIVISERTSPKYHTIGRLWEKLRRLSYPWANMIVAQTKAVANWLTPIAKAAPITVIYNPISQIDTHYFLEYKYDSKTIVAMGRLSYQKGFDLLITAFSNLSKYHPDWKLVIYGEGEQRKVLEKQVIKLNLESKVLLPGRVKNSYKYLQHADLFVLSSRYEGFPNVLLEAMNCGLPVISFDCPSGPREIIRDGVDGVLVPAENVDALSHAMQELMEDQIKRTRIATKALEVQERFDIGNIMKQWEMLVNEVSKS